MFTPKNVKKIETATHTVYQDSLGNTFKIVPKYQEQFADAIVAIGHGRGGAFVQIDKEDDWLVLEHLVDLYCHFYTEDWKKFVEETAKMRSYRANKHGLLADPEAGKVYDKLSVKGNEAGIRQVANWPFELEFMIRVIYPDHKFDKKFLDKFVNRFPEFSTLSSKLRN